MCTFLSVHFFSDTLCPQYCSHFLTKDYVFLHLCLLYSFSLLHCTNIPLYSVSIVWAAKVPTVPVQMAVTSFGNQKGLIVCMDDCGGLSINYMGE